MSLVHRNLNGHMYLLTITAPGEAGHRRWSPAARARRHVCGCEQSMAAGPASWNASAGRRWNHCLTLLRRLSPDLEFFRAAEVQRRGLLHQHVPLWSPVPLDPVEVQAAALAAGFGCVFDLQEVTSPQQVARYVGKYVSKSTDQREDVPWERLMIDPATGEVREVRTRPTYRSYSTSRTWGLTMRDCIAAARRAAAISTALRAASAAPAAPADAATLPTPAADATGPPG
jgi:hypothetical protein